MPKISKDLVQDMFHAVGVNKENFDRSWLKMGRSGLAPGYRLMRNENPGLSPLRGRCHHATEWLVAKGGAEGEVLQGFYIPAKFIGRNEPREHVFAVRVSDRKIIDMTAEQFEHYSLIVAAYDHRILIPKFVRGRELSATATKFAAIYTRLTSNLR
jgi:hypothetical protein